MAIENFDDARERAAEMFGGEGEQETILPEETPETPQETEPENAQEAVPEEGAPEVNDQNEVIDSALDEASRTAEDAANMAAQRSAELEEAMARISALERQNSELQERIGEMSNASEEQTIAEALEPPVIDISALAFADDETVAAAQSEYAQKMAEYNRREIMKELKPFIDEAKAGRAEKERNEAYRVLSTVPELAGIGELKGQIDNIIATSPIFKNSDAPIDDKIVTAYLIAKAVNGRNEPAKVQTREMSNDELLEAYKNNDEFRDAVEKYRIGQLNEGQQVPTLSGSGGAVSAALNIQKKPESWDEALERSMQAFRE